MRQKRSIKRGIKLPVAFHDVRDVSVLVALTPGGGGTPGNSCWGCAAARLSNFPHPFSDQISKIRTHFRFGLKAEIMLSLLRFLAQTKKILQIHFKFAYFSFFFTHFLEPGKAGMVELKVKISKKS